MKQMKAMLLLAIFTFCVIPASAMPGVYENLSNNEIDTLSHFYQNNTEFVYVFNQSCEIQKDYPFFSYTLALKCHRQVIKKDILNQIQREGKEQTIKNLNESLRKEINDLGSEIYQLNNSERTFSANEWLSLSSDELSKSAQKLREAQEYLGRGNADNAVDSLVGSSFDLYKAKIYLNVAKEESYSQSKIDAEEFKTLEKGIAQKWISDAENKIQELKTAEVGEFNGGLPQDYLNISKKYYSEENYYLSTMHAASSIALVKIELSNETEITNQSVIITKAKEELTVSKNSFENITATQGIDSPITELHLEMAGVYLEEADKNDSASVYPLAVDSIRNSIIAREQTRAVSELLANISEPADPLTISEDTQKVSSGIMDSGGKLLKIVSKKFTQYFF